MSFRTSFMPFLLIAAFALFLLVTLWSCQGRLIYFPDRGSEDLRALGLPDAESVRFRADDGTGLHGWFHPATAPARGLAALVCHGNAGNASMRAQRLGDLSRLGLATLVFDYRGYGLSDDASPTEAGLQRDGRAALDWLLQRTGLPLERVVLVGESLGCAVAIELAARGPGAPAALVLEAPFTSLVDAGAAHYPFLPVSLILRDRYDNLARIGEVRAPVLVIHGAEDHIVPVALGREVFAHAPEPKRLLVIDGVGHNDLWLDARSRRAELAAFLDEVAAPAAGEPAAR
jgi:fermentation-respiration switch protein FrsA (DUF1100 family)